ncbi:MAG: putative MFS-type transporter YcaD [Alphaproteobacteria bacterium MarineAlpha5_Bin9]|nr:MAG: putative MFS-type transporter YcaD [Alphaproteobacteria bacterium MarineAlpha5_Bin9]|tara:strand:+ start:1700 stop:2869 length:1170 start_codon:yes stop_codon:yes gene_type:complete
MINSIKRYIDLSSINPSIKYLSITAFFTGVVLGYFFTIITIFQKYEGYSELTIGIIASSSAFGLMTAGFFVTYVLEKIGLYKTFIFSILIQGICILSICLFFNPINLAFCYFISGLMGGMNWMTMDTWVNIVSTNSNRGKAIGFYNSAITIGFLMGPLFIGIFGVTGFIPFIITGLFFFVRLLSVILIKKHINNVKIPRQATNLDFSFLKIAPFIFLAIFISGIDDSSFTALFPVYMINELFSDKQIGIYIFIGGIFGVIVQPFIGALTDRINKRKLIFGLLYCHILWPLILIFYKNTFTTLIAISIWGIASISLYTVALAYLGERINIKKIAIATSLFIIVYEAGEFLGPIIVGFIMDRLGNNGFLYTIFYFTIFSIVTGYIRNLTKK